MLRYARKNHSSIHVACVCVCVTCYDFFINLLFVVQTACWIADPDEVYIRGKIVGGGPDKFDVETAVGVSLLNDALF